MSPDDYVRCCDQYLAAVEAQHAIARRLAPLRARYGAFGTFDHDRKILLATCADWVRLGAVTKLTEAAIDEKARLHPDYRAFIERAYTERTELAEGEADEVRENARIAYYRAQMYTFTKLAQEIGT